MLKQSIMYLLLSVLAVVFANYVHVFIVYVVMLYTYVHLKLSPLLNQGGVGGMISKVIILVLVPVVIAAIPALIYRLIKRQDMPYFIELTWCLWLIIVLSNILIR